MAPIHKITFVEVISPCKTFLVTKGKIKSIPAIKKTQKRANALKNIMIPRFEATVKMITSALDEKSREDFSRLKIIKAQKAKKAGQNEQQTQ